MFEFLKRFSMLPSVKSNRKKLLVFSHSGVVSLNRILYQKLGSNESWDVRLVVPSSWQGNLIRNLEFTPVPQDTSIRIFSLPTFFSGKGSLFFYRSFFTKVIDPLWQPDIVFIDEEPWSLVAFQIGLFFRKFPQVFYTKENLPRSFPFPFSLFQKLALRKSIAAFSISKESSEILRVKKKFRGKVFELPHAVDDSRFFKKGEHEKTVVRNQLGLNSDQFVVGYVGRLSQEKGVLDLMSVARRFEGQGQLSPIFLFVGSGPLERQISGSNIVVQSAVPHDQISNWLGMLDLLVVPSRTTASWKEQFGRVIIEAMACGIPVLGSTSGEIPYVIHSTHGGDLFDEGDLTKLFEKIGMLHLNSSLRQTLGEEGYKSVKERFTYNAVAQGLSEKLSGLIQ